MSKRALITGLNGFVGPYLKLELESGGYEVFGLDRHAGEFGTNIWAGDIRDAKFVDDVFKFVKPDYVYNLAGFSSVQQSFKEPELAFDINVNGTRSVLNAIRSNSPDARVLVVSSAEVYGVPTCLSVTEDEPLKETSPYSKSRIAQEKLVSEFSDLNAIIARSFNHTGPGQSETFVLPSFVKQVVDIKNAIREPVLLTGNIDVIRDFSDVRDVVRAYRLLMEKGNSGEVYNVGSGNGYCLRELIDKIIKLADVEVEVKSDPDKFRPVEITEMVADISKLKNEIGYSADYSIDKTIKDLLEYFYNKL